MSLAPAQIADPNVELRAGLLTDLLPAPPPELAPEHSAFSPERLRPEPGRRPAEYSPEPPVCAHPTDKLTFQFPARDFISGHDFEVAFCAACGLAVTTPRPEAGELASYYPCGYYGALGARRFPRIVESLQEALCSQRVRQVELAAGGKRGRVLDVGCGRGWLLQEFRRRGWRVQGTELSDEAARYARQVLKLPVETGSLDSIAFPSGYFDAVTLWHVLEHVPNPQALLAEASRILRPGGVLLVSVPNFGGLEARVFRDKWFHLDVPRHVTHFTQDTLAEVLGETGFHDARWSGFAPEYDAFSFIQSALNRCGLRHNLLYDLLRGKRAKLIASGQAPRWQMLATFLLGAVLGVLSFPVTLCAGWLGRGGTMTVVATKECKPPVEPSRCKQPAWQAVGTNRLSAQTA